MEAVQVVTVVKDGKVVDVRVLDISSSPQDTIQEFRGLYPGTKVQVFREVEESAGQTEEIDHGR